ncbi:MAG: translocation/assembly module TamB domain-containing protein [Candidatus Saccharicenans sp.]
MGLTEGPKKKKFVRKIFKILAWTTGIAAIIILSVALLLETRMAGKIILKMAGKILNQQAGLIVKAESVQLNIFKLQASIKGLEVRPTEKSQLPLNYFSCQKVLLRSGWKSITGQSLYLKDLEVIGPKIYLKSTAGKEEKIKTADKSGRKSPQNFKFRLDNLEIKEALFSFQDMNQAISASVSGVEIKVLYQPASGWHQAWMHTSLGIFEIGSARKILKSLDLEADFNSTQINLRKFYLSTAQTNLNLAGEIKDYLREAKLALNFSGKVNLDEFNDLVKSPEKSSGDLNFNFKLIGKLPDISLAGELEGTALSINGINPVDINLAVKPVDKSNELVEGLIKMPTGQISLKAKLLSDFRGPFQSQLILNRIDLSQLSSISPRFPFILNSVLTGKVEVSGTELSPKKIRAKIEWQSSPIEKSFSASGTRAFVPIISEIKAFYAPGKLEIQNLSLKVFQTDFNFKGVLTDGDKITGRLLLNLPDIGVVRANLLSSGLNDIFPRVNSRLNKLGDLKGRLRLEGEFRGSLKRPELDLALKGDNFSLRKVFVPRLEISLSGTPDQMKIQEFVVEFDRGRIEGSGELLVQEKVSSYPYKFEGQIAFSKIDLGQFNELLPKDGHQNLNGFLSGLVKMKGSPSFPSIDFGLSLDQLSYGHQGIDSLEIAGSYQNEILRVEKLLMVKAESQLAGHFIFIHKTGELQADLNAENFKADFLKAWVPAIRSGQIDFHLKSSGLWKSPVLDFQLVGQGVMIERIWLPYFELKISGDGQRGQAQLEVPLFNLSLEAGLEFNSPYWLKGQARIKQMPLSLLAGLRPEVEEVPPEVALNLKADFSLPLEDLAKLQAQLKFEDFDFKGLATLVPSLKNLNPGGKADGQITINGFSPDLSRVQILAEIPNLNLRLNDLEVKNDFPLKLAWEDGDLKILDFNLSTGKSRLKLSGHSRIKNFQNPELDFSLWSDLEISDFNPWLTGLSAGGRFQLQADLKGDRQNPLVEGKGDFKEIFVRFLDLPILVSNVNGLIEVDNSKIRLKQFNGRANSGDFASSGEAFFGPAFSLESAKIDFNLNDFDFNYQGLSTLSKARLNLNRNKQGWLLSGDLSVLSANYRQDFFPSTQGLKMALTRVSPVGTEIPPFLYEVALDVNVQTIENIIIKNNLADLELKANLKAKGTVPAPILSGRIENAYPGEIVIGERRYSVERMQIDFLGKENLEPNLDISLKSNVTDQEEEVEVNVNLSGTPSELKFSLSSTPTRSQEDLAALLLTGKSLKEVQGSAVNTISSQLIQQFSSPLTSPVTRTLKKWLKAEDVILEPLNIATLQDPGARLTIKKRMTREVAVTYSINLANSQYQTWILDYNLRRNFSLRGFRQDDGTVGLNLRHRFSLGHKTSELGVKEEVPRKILKQVEIKGEAVISPDEAKKILNLKTGKQFNNFKVQKSLERLASWYRKKGYANARFETRKEETGEAVSLSISIDAGRPVEFRFEGDRLPARLRKKALNSWVNRLPEEANLSQLQQMVLLELERRGYYQSVVNVRKMEENNKIIYLTEVRTGGKWKIKSFRLEGHPVFKESLIRRVVSNYFGAKASGLWNLIYDRRVALELIQYFYLENGYLQARIESPLVKENSGKRELNLSLKIEAGPQSHVRSIKFEGYKAKTESELEKILTLKPGSIFSWPALTENKTALINYYRSAGFKEVKVESRAEPVEGSPDYQVVFILEEGQPFLVSEVEISGVRRTRPSFILKESGLKLGEPVSLERMAQAQKNLYDSGVFQMVNVSSAPEASQSLREKILIQVKEQPWMTLTYGLQYNSETKFEGFTQFDFNNLFGWGWNSLLFLRANKRQQEARYSLKVPFIFSRKTNSLLSFYYLKDIKDLYITEQIGTSFQQKISVVRGFDVSWVYKLNRIHDYEPTPSWPFPYDVRVLTSEISILVNRDTRDDQFDPHRGSLLTANFSYSPRFLGSQLNYISTFTQFTMYKTIVPGLLWASCYRLGLASAFGEVLIPSKRFFAGGGTSIRGFKLDAVGPVDIWTGLPEGGEAMLVINQELRFPIYKIFKGVAFFDAGNVYSRLGDFNPARLRTGAGLGLRIESPIGLIRADYGFNLKPRPGEPKSTIFFSLGQAF